MASLFDKVKESLGFNSQSYPNYGPPSVSSSAYKKEQEKQSNLSKLTSASKRRKKKRRQRAARAAAAKAAADAAAAAEAEKQDDLKVETVTPETEAPQLPVDPVDNTLGPKTETKTPDKPIKVTDLETSTGGTVSETSITAPTIYQATPESAMSEQEKLAQEELRRQRIKRARQKQSLIRRRLERKSEVGSGRRVLSGTEKELNVQTRQAGSGRRRGAGRRSLITGSTGGIGYYSRFL